MCMDGKKKQATIHVVVRTILSLAIFHDFDFCSMFNRERQSDSEGEIKARA